MMTADQRPPSYSNPPLVEWSAERTARGASPDHGPRCPVPACPVRYANGDDRLCRDHVRDGVLGAPGGSLAGQVVSRHKYPPRSRKVRVTTVLTFDFLRPSRFEHGSGSPPRNTQAETRFFGGRTA